MDHGAHMRVAEIEYVRASGIEKRSAEYVDALTAADHRRLLPPENSARSGSANFDRARCGSRKRDREEIS